MTFIAFGSQKIWLFLSGCSVTLDWFERSLSLWFVLGVCLSPSLVNLSNGNMHDLGSTKFSLIFNWNSQSSACTSCCIFWARLRVIGPVGVGYVAGEVAGVPGEIGKVADAGMVISSAYWNKTRNHGTIRLSRILGTSSRKRSPPYYEASLASRGIWGQHLLPLYWYSILLSAWNLWHFRYLGARHVKGYFCNIRKIRVLFVNCV
jgi:hypothetical protein